MTLKDDEGNWHTEEGQLRDMKVSFFRNLYGTTQDVAEFKRTAGGSRLSADQLWILQSPVTAAVVKMALFKMHPLKFSGPDGLQRGFKCQMSYAGGREEEAN